MNSIDIAVVAVYFITVIAIGAAYRKRAASDLDSYFLGGKRIHWLALAMSGSVSNFDITGTMWIVSMLYLMGMRSMWIHWMWGCMMGAFCLAYMGKWVRRSKVMTGAEWMVTRFGDGHGGRIARLAYAAMAVITLSSFIGYAFQGIGKFASVYIPLPPQACAVLIIAITTVYVIMGGLFSVVVTDVIQTVILTFASILIAVVAYQQLTPDALASLPADWASLRPVWRLEQFAGTDNAQYEWFGLLMLVWVLKGLILNAGGPAQLYDFQRFLAARDSRDAAKIGAAWSVFMIPRWGMTMGIVLLALTGVANVTDPEKVMPMVLHDYLPAGMRGLVIAGLLAAFMSTFSSIVNGAASYIVRDFWEPLQKGQATQKSLIRASYVSTIAVVVVGIAIGFQAKSIEQIWNWIMMALGAGVVIPNFLRWYWWRTNGWGYAAGTLGGILFSLVALFRPDAPMYATFPIITIGSLLATVFVSLLVPPVEPEILNRFYTTVRPFGLWGPVRNALSQTGDGAEDSRMAKTSSADDRCESASLAVFNTLVGIVAIGGFYLAPMYLVGHWHAYAGICLALGVLSIITLAFTWYKNLPAKGE